MDFRIRRARKGDLPELRRMRAALQDLLVDKDPRVYRLSQEFLGEIERFYGEIIAKSDSRIFIAVDEKDRPVAMAMVRVLDNPHMEPRPMGRIDDAWVEPAWRGRGVMKALTSACARFLIERKVRLVMLDWANNNPPSGECWQRIGFVPLMTMGFAAPEALAIPGD